MGIDSIKIVCLGYGRCGHVVALGDLVTMVGVVGAGEPGCRRAGVCKEYQSFTRGLSSKNKFCGRTEEKIKELDKTFTGEQWDP